MYLHRCLTIKTASQMICAHFNSHRQGFSSLSFLALRAAKKKQPDLCIAFLLCCFVNVVTVVYLLFLVCGLSGNSAIMRLKHSFTEEPWESRETWFVTQCCILHRITSCCCMYGYLFTNMPVQVVSLKLIFHPHTHLKSFGVNAKHTTFTTLYYLEFSSLSLCVYLFDFAQASNIALPTEGSALEWL